MPPESPNSILSEFNASPNIREISTWAFSITGKSRKKEKNAAQNYSMILKCCINLLKAHKDKGSMNNKKLKCALSDKYRSNVLK